MGVPARECSRTACSRPAVSSLTFVYEDSTAVLGPLSRVSEPHAYDLCREHAAGMTAPRGWELLRVAGGEEVSDDLLALADAVRPPRATPPSSPAAASSAATRPSGASGAAHRARENAETGPRHLHVLRGSDD
nr:DUF3499 domain-containing protein [Brachybacterium alimentarium]